MLAAMSSVMTAVSKGKITLREAQVSSRIRGEHTKVMTARSKGELGEPPVKERDTGKRH